MKVTIEDAGESGDFYRSLWLYPLIQGGIISLAGIILLIFPKVGLIFMSVMFGLYLFMLGLGQTVLAFKLSSLKEHWWKLLIRSILILIVGVLILWYPFSFAKIGMGIPLVAGGIFLIINSMQDLLNPDFRSRGKTEQAGSLLTVLLGILLCFAPVFSALMLFRIIGGLSLFSGTFLIVRALSNRTTPH